MCWSGPEDVLNHPNEIIIMRPIKRTLLSDMNSYQSGRNLKAAPGFLIQQENGLAFLSVMLGKN